MGKCDLSIELDDPQRIYRGGDTITGTLNVAVDENVNCKGLEIRSGWRTHGRGNVAQGTAQIVTLFSGQWMAGHKQSYRFELAVADWPPSYHGHLINVDHYIDARAKIPWAFDPKVSVEFLVRPNKPPATQQPTNVIEISGCIGNALVAFLIIGIIGFIGGVVAAFFASPLVGLLVASVAVPVIGIFAAKQLLPRWLLGNVETELLTPAVAPGERIRARMAFQPKRALTINSITADLTGAEVCVSGSGSNRKTHRNTFFSDRHELLGAQRLQAGDRKEFHLDFPIPEDVPFSFDLADNDLIWAIDLRVDIPRWPDWTKSLKLQVYPGDPAAESSPPDSQPVETSEPIQSDVTSGITFGETASHLWQVRDDEDQVDILVEAVLGLSFEIETTIERRLLYSGPEDPHVYKDGYAVWARNSDPPLPLVLYIPHEMADEFEQAGRDVWRCYGTVVGWDHDHGRLQIKVLVR